MRGGSSNLHWKAINTLTFWHGVQITSSKPPGSCGAVDEECEEERLIEWNVIKDFTWPVHQFFQCLQTGVASVQSAVRSAPLVVEEGHHVLVFDQSLPVVGAGIASDQLDLIHTGRRCDCVPVNEITINARSNERSLDTLPPPEKTRVGANIDQSCRLAFSWKPTANPEPSTGRL